MGRRRQQQPRKSSYSPREVAAASAIATLFAGGSTAATVSSIASILLPLVPSSLVSRPDDAASVVELVARQTVQQPPDASRVAIAGPIERAMTTERLLYRGFYAVAALRRVSKGALGGPDELRQAVRRERGYFLGHREQSDRRVVGGRSVDAARELYGVELGWYHLNPTMDPRPHHLRAHGKNFRADVLVPPISTGAWPGVENNCGCVAGPPHVDGELMLATR